MKSDDCFIQALNGSQKAVSAVAAWLKLHNCDVMIRPMIIRPNFESRNEFADCGDIEIRQRIEVKQRQIEFTSAIDYPYGTVLIDEKFKIDRIKKTQLWGYLIVNKTGTCVCCVKPQSKSSWVLERKFDRNDGQEREFYACPTDLCTFHELA